MNFKFFSRRNSVSVVIHWLVLSVASIPVTQVHGEESGAALAEPPPASSAPFDLADPFATADLAAKDRQGEPLRELPCQRGNDVAKPGLPEVVDRALCNNPQTRQAWANVRYQAAQSGVAQSAYWPKADVSLSHARNGGGERSYDQTSASLSLGYLLFDFGGRSAALENARMSLAASMATRDATLQGVFFFAAQAYYQWHAAQAAVTAARESERSSQESLKGALARHRAGTATPADRLQAQTVASQAILARIRAEGDFRVAQGVLMNAMGLPADQFLDLAPPADAPVDAGFEQKVGELIEAAKRQRPDLAAVEAQAGAARAGIEAARAAGRPNISLFARRNDVHSSIADVTRGNSIGLSLSVPIFSGFDTTYRVRAAEAQLEAKEAERERLALQVSLDVWRAYHALMTETQAVRAAADLLASATQSEKVAAGRYRAGVGGILDLLNAQTTLAGARQQQVQANLNWRLARIGLAQAVGRLDLPASGEGAKPGVDR